MIILVQKYNIIYLNIFEIINDLIKSIAIESKLITILAKNIERF